MTKNIARIWDKEYKNGKYAGEGPISFVEDIMSTLSNTDTQNGGGLYVGCGNGRNYVPLVERGLNLIGLDTSKLALEQIKNRYPKSQSKLVLASYLDYNPGYLFDYLISIQVFQHGNFKTAREYFKKTADLLKPGGLFFLRVNSVNTDIFFDHDQKRQTDGGGLTVTYSEGSKKMLDVHFFSEKEIENLVRGKFLQVSGPKEIAIERSAPKAGKWVQWEAIYQRQ